MNPEKTLRKWTSTRLLGATAIVILTVTCIACSGSNTTANQAETLLRVIAGYLALAFLTAFGAAVLWSVLARDELGTLIEENGGGASMARFQFLIFTFVVAFGIVFLLAKNNAFPNVPADVLTLIGISASTYAVSKGITASSPDLKPKKVPPPAGPPPA